MGKVIGIDLGTTNSVVAVMEGTTPKVLVNGQGSRLTPSVVGFTEKGEKLVGQLAKHQQVTNPSNTIFSIKRFMGRRHGEVSSEEKLVPYEVFGGEQDPVRVRAQGKEYTPQEVSAMILQDLKKTAEEYLGDSVEGAVITVPAYFNDSQRLATKEAGEIAGLKVDRVLPEPTAAAIAFGMDKKNDMKVAVFDLGGGTFDISILDVGDGVFKTLSINGDTHLGGDDYDQVLIDYLAEEFRKKEGLDLREEPMALQRLKDEAEKAKKALSESLEYTVNLPFVAAVEGTPKHLNETITRAKFESLSSHLTERLRKPVQDALADAKLSAGEVDEVLLVGGSTRIPAVQKLVKSLFNKDPNRSVNPDEVVAIGAALQAGVISGDVDDLVVLDVTPLSLGVETKGGVMTTMIPRNTTIPTSKSEVYSTAADNQTQVTIHVLQGERPMAGDNRSLGQFNLEGIPPAPMGMPQIEVTFNIDKNGILNVTAKDKGSGKEQKIEIKGSTGLEPDEIDRMVKEAEANASKDKERAELAKVKNEAEQAIHETQKSLGEYGEKVSAEDRTKIEQAVSNLQDVLKTDELKPIQSSLDRLKEAAQALGKAMYEAEASQAGGGQPGAAAGAGASGATAGAGVGSGSGAAKKDDDVIDAEYEVKE